MPRLLDILAADTPATLRICGESSGFALVAAEGQDAARPKKFSMTAYTGGPMRPLGFSLPVVVDLQGAQVPTQRIPILKAHDPEQIVGHSDSVEVTAQRIKLAGVISGVGDAAKEVVDLAANDFPWQASIGASVQQMEFVDRGESVTVNGRSFTGPLYVARKTTLGEVSFVALGADSNTSAKVAASHAKGATMFEEWVKGKGFDLATLTDAGTATLKAMFDAEQAAKEKKEAGVKAGAETRVLTRDDIAELLAKQEAKWEERQRAIAARQANIRTICAGFPEIEVKAIAENWDEKDAKIAILQAGRHQGGFIAPAGNPADAARNASVIEASLCSTLGLKNIEKHYSAQVLEAAHKEFGGRIGLKQMLLIAATANGYRIRAGDTIHDGNVREVVEYAFGKIRAAGFSTLGLGGILQNVANKMLLMGYMEEDNTWTEISRIIPKSNFYQHTHYRMLDDMEYEELGPGGEIKHGAVGVESYTSNLRTFAKMFTVERTQIINDDLGALDSLRERLGRGAAKKFNNLFWTNMLAGHSTFFTTARGNYITGATTTLLTDGVGLGLGVQQFRKMKTPTSPQSDGTPGEGGGKRIGGQPSVLIVPPELESAAEVLYRNTNLGAVSSATANIYANKYRPVVVPWLSDSNFTGYSTTAWYLFRAPTELPMMVVSFLNGNQAPTVESADADFNVLGFSFRGYHDFYADQAEYLCGVKSKGAA